MIIGKSLDAETPAKTSLVGIVGRCGWGDVVDSARASLVGDAR